MAAVDRLVTRVNEALPRGRVRSAFSGTAGLSPNAVTVVGALPGVALVALAVASKRPVLLLAALLVMAAAIVGVMRFGNTTRVVAELPDELVVFTSRRGALEPYQRGPVPVEIRPYFDSRWLKVVVGSDQLFVSKRAFGAVVRRLAGEESGRRRASPMTRPTRAGPTAWPGSPEPMVAPMSSDPDNWQWHAGRVSPGTAVVFDLDGVLSDAVGRQHYLERPFRDWEAFFEACGDDPLIDEVARLLEVIGPDHQIVLLTARPIRVQRQTLGWLERYQLRWDLLIMRDYGDYGASREFKRRTVYELRTFGFDLRLAFEDDRRNYDMFHAEGVPCVYIHSGYYE